VTPAGSRLAGYFVSLLTFRADELQFFRRQGPVDSALGFRHGLSFGRGWAGHGLRFQHKSPFPYLPPESLNDGVFDVSIYQLQSSSRSRRTASPSGFLDFSHTFDGPLR
jgi:hypothetical protein